MNGARAQPIRPKHSQSFEAAPFEGRSAYHDQFQEPGSVQYERHRPVAKKIVTVSCGGGVEREWQSRQHTICNLSTAQGEFYGETTYSGAFVERGAPAPPKLIHRASNFKPSKATFDGQSVYKTMYT